MRGFSKTRILTECAVLIALGTVLAQIKILRMPSGGSVTLLSMLPFIIISFRHGPRWGLLSGLVNAALQMALGGVYAPPAGTAAALIGSVLLDYVLAYAVLGLAGLFYLPQKKPAVGVAAGTLVVCFFRFLCALLSGFLIWGSLTDGVWAAFVYSLGYNASYMIPETLLTVASAYLLAKTNYNAIFRPQK